MAEAEYASWNILAHNVAYICWAAGIPIVLGYIVRLSTIPDNKDKYDFINRHEVNVLWYASIILVLEAVSSLTEILLNPTIMYFVRGFVTIMMGVLVALIIQNLLKFYYPFFIEKRLKVLRYKPRISPRPAGL